MPNWPAYSAIERAIVSKKCKNISLVQASHSLNIDLLNTNKMTPLNSCATSLSLKTALPGRHLVRSARMARARHLVGPARLAHESRHINELVVRQV